MIRDSKQVILYKRQNSSEFYRINMDVLKENERYLGSGAKAVAAMLVNGDELKVLMPTILAVDPRSHTSNWETLVANYWNGLTIGVPDNGKPLEIGMIYDIKDTTTFFDGRKRIDYIRELQKDNPSIKTDEDLMNYIKGEKDGIPNVMENEKYKYCKPINNSDYLLWRYCLVSYEVAPNIDTVNKSPNIRFYLHDATKIEDDRKKAFETRTKAHKAYMEIFTDEAELDKYIYLFAPTHPIPYDTSKFGLIEKQMHLENIINSKPNEFLQYRKDKLAGIKATIEMYIVAGLLRRLPNTQIIVNGDNQEIIIGNTMEEAVRYFTNEKNKVEISQLEAKYKGLKN